MIDYDGVIDMVSDMEDCEKLLGRKGRFVGGMVHISIKDLADISRNRTQPQAVKGLVDMSLNN